MLVVDWQIGTGLAFDRRIGLGLEMDRLRIVGLFWNWQNVGGR